MSELELEIFNFERINAISSLTENIADEEEKKK